ncbi:class I SAM-dependent methyltransferase [Leptospira kanakyensis]|uniref:Class I SAM-dependent methyltransferase n=1 Tax=Leptospira kanakyensis TaxID=2484968 RepID=A0A6N4Q8S2_9LEPT|nr:class I SAM-dependent methyltransferase [Leptospira kanakyensis]TGK47543.1 class I SAM-dependent methyltransferase [Leptospira kanakyensis]TGK63454.1 class I SAM-dependent methyltransferase [Leptospira kanakyensis]TGK67057.1 class I SAM-dependent methyltransferase [Leptospira kanakyensis]
MTTTLIPNEINVNDRVRFYSEAFPKYAPLHIFNGSIYGEWRLGQNFKNTSDYWGAYPEQYLPRATSLFPEKKEVLHLFSGKTPPGDYLRMDKNPANGSEIVGDAEKLSSYAKIYKPGGFDIIYADCPYTKEDADHYGYCMISRPKVLRECWQSLIPGGHVVWLDQVVPQWSNDDWFLEGIIYMFISSNRRVRAVSIFKKVVV